MVTLGILVSFKGSLGVTSWHSEVVLRVGNLLGLFFFFCHWRYSCIILEILWYHFGVTLDLLWGHFRVALESHWGIKGSLHRCYGDTLDILCGRLLG